MKDTWSLKTEIFTLLILISMVANAREWTCRDGKRTVGDFVKYDGTNVTIRQKSNLKTITFDFTLLSEADQEFVQGKAQPGVKQPLTSAAKQYNQTKVPTLAMGGIRGLEKAKRIQQESGLPIILWSTWATCPYCAEVSGWFDSSKEMRALRRYPRVILQSKGDAAEVKESQRKDFNGGELYAIFDYEKGDMEKVWAWEQGTRKLKPDLAKQIMDKIDARLPKAASGAAKDK